MRRKHVVMALEEDTSSVLMEIGLWLVVYRLLDINYSFLSCIIYTIHCTVYGVHCTIKCTLYAVHCTIQCTVFGEMMYLQMHTLIYC